MRSARALRKPLNTLNRFIGPQQSSETGAIVDPRQSAPSVLFGTGSILTISGSRCQVRTVLEKIGKRGR